MSSTSVKRQGMALGSKKRSKGFTLVEMGIVVAIGAIIIGVGIAVVPGIMASNRVNAEVSELPTIVTNIQRAYNNQPGFTPAPTIASLANLGVFPESRARPGDAAAVNRWGGAITVAAAGATLPNGLTLTYADVPSAECRELVPALSNSFRVITVGTTVVKPDGGNVNMTTLPGLCNVASGRVNIAYSFTK